MTQPSDIEHDILMGFIEESLEALALAEESLVRLESDPENSDHVNAVFRAVHSLKGNAAFFDLMRVKRLAHKMEDILDDIRNKKVSINKSLIDILLPGSDLLRRMLESVREGNEECTEEKRYNRILSDVENYSPKAEEDVVDRIRRHLIDIRDVLGQGDQPLIDDLLNSDIFKDGEAPPPPPAIEETATETSATETPREEMAPAETIAFAKADKTMRISESSLDEFLAHVGELLGVEEMLSHVSRRIGSGNQTQNLLDELKQTIQQFSKLSAALRNGIMDIRKISPKGLFGKVPRTVREIAGTTGKKVSVSCAGDDIRIDKSYADLLDAPLMHMVRNAVDHGIEMPDERETNGKNPEGRLSVELLELENDIVMVITDDGRGLDIGSLTRKAVDMGLMQADATPTEEDIVRVLFVSGVSTAKEVTEISGRGVGMDVVRQSIEDAGGQIRVTNHPGHGCEFRIMLPRNVSTRIVDGYLVRGRSGTVYVLPLKSVLEAFAPESSDLGTVQNKGRIVRRRGMIYPLVDLEALIDPMARLGPVKCDDKLDGISTLVLIRFAKQTAAIAVSEVVGVQKIVVKPMEGLQVNTDLLEGAALMGDGRVALVVGGKGIQNLFDHAAKQLPKEKPVGKTPVPA